MSRRGDARCGGDEERKRGERPVEANILHEVARQKRRRQQVGTEDAGRAAKKSRRAAVVSAGGEVARAHAVEAVYADFVAACTAVRRQFSSDTKTARSTRRNGVEVGVRGVFARWLFRQQLSRRTREAVDPLLPCAGASDRVVVGELVDAGVNGAVAADIAKTLMASATREAKAWASLSARFASAEARRVVRTTTAEGMVELRHGDAVMRVHAEHWTKLKTVLFKGREEELCHRVFCMVQRYEAMSGHFSGYQGALPDHVFGALSDLFGVHHECFASPLNAFFPNFCSAFPDTDTCFGSVGDFFDFYPRTGSFQCNPPFVDEVMTQTARHIDGLLRASTAPLSFIIIVPAWQGDCQSYLLTTTSPFLRHTKRLKRKQHQYKDGMQHRVERVTWDANVDSFMFWMQNDAGAERWPTTRDSMLLLDLAIAAKAP